jgi:hypothetical protein
MTTRDRINIYIITGLIAAMLLALCVPACKESPVPAPAPKSSSPLIVNLCGLGNTEGAPPDGIVAMERILFPEAQIVYFKPNGWLSPATDYIRKSEYSKLIVLGHSFGAHRAALTASEVQVDLLILIDPVAYGTGEDTITVPASVKRTLVFRRSSEGAGVVGMARRANINGKIEMLNVDKNHSTICDAPEVRIAIQDAITEAIRD